MESTGGFLSDLNDILAGNPSNTPNTLITIGVIVVSLMIAFTAFALMLKSFLKIFERKEVPKPEPKLEMPTPKEREIEVGEFGKIINDTQVSIHGKELNYFIIKKNKHESDKLPIGTIVVIIKKSSNEAYVKPADKKDAARLKNVL